MLMSNRLGRILRTMLAALLLTVISIPAALAGGIDAYFNTSTKVYRRASTSSTSVKVSKGTSVEIKAINGDWAKIKKNCVTAYCKLSQLTLEDRIHGYISSPTPLYRSASASSKKAGTFSVNDSVYIIGKSGSFFHVENKSGSVDGYVYTKYVSMSKVAEEKPQEPEQKPEDEKKEESNDLRDKVVIMDWFADGSSVLKKGEYATLYDISTGISMRIKRMGGSSHADIEPATAADTEKLLKIAGGTFSWDSHAVILIANGKYVACAINTMPHGDQTILDNNYDGQFCLHMYNSKTHGSDSVNSEHQKAILAAYNWAHS